jgi:Zn-dependent metalloprotease
MCNHSFCPQGVCFIIPPYMLKHLASHAKDAKLRARAMENLVLQAQIRGMRAAFSQFGFFSLGTGTKRRTIYDAQHQQALPGKIVRSEGKPKGKDAAVNEAYDFCGNTYDFYETVFNRNSVDGRGMRLDSSVHYGVDYDNAFWNGRQMVYGDGDGQLFGRFTQCLDVIGHELTHGVTQFTAKLEYHDQPGALNESMSDVFGIMIKQWALKQTVDKADWLIGAGLLIPKAGTDRKALRSMAAPGTAYDDPDLGKDPQPDNMKNYYKGADDEGGVHINSGIPNHAFYLAAMTIGGNAWDVTGKIWYEVLTTKLQPSAQFAEAAAATVDVAQKYGAKAVAAVKDAWKAVGVLKK